VERSCFDAEVILSEKEQIIRKSGILEYFRAQERFADIGGLDALKDWLRKRSSAFTERARDYGLPQPKGIMLLGVQGCGKSLTAKAIASLYGLPLLRLDVGRVFSGIIGSSEARMRRAIQTANSIAPCVLWIDEIDKGLSGTHSSTFSDAGTASRVFATFVTWLQEKESAVFVVATANDVTNLPPELLRKGRFDEIFFVDLPSAAERSEIFQIHLQKRKREPADFNTEELAAACPGFSGAEIEQALISAMYDAFAEEREIEVADIVQAIHETVPLSVTMQEEIQWLRQWSAARTRPASSMVSEEFVEEDAVRARSRGGKAEAGTGE
jgi:SpoVK/Ycf46/Vps4 family AAA+-type ATPase